MLARAVDILSRLVALAGFSQQQSPEALSHDFDPSERTENDFNIERHPSVETDLLYQLLQKIRAAHAEAQKMPIVKFPLSTKEGAASRLTVSRSRGPGRRQTIIGLNRRFSQCNFEDLRRGIFSLADNSSSGCSYSNRSQSTGYVCQQNT